MAGTVSMYDFDGTLINTMMLHGKCAARCINRYFDMPLEEAEAAYHSTTGIPFPLQLKQIFPDASDSQRKQCYNDYISRKMSEVYEAAEFFPDVADSLDKISNLSIPQTISTSTEKDLTEYLLGKHEIRSYFEEVRGLEQGVKDEHIHEVKREFNPERIFFTGDSRSDMALNRIENVITVGRYASLDEHGNPKDMLLQPRELRKAGADTLIESLYDLYCILKY